MKIIQQKQIDNNVAISNNQSAVISNVFSLPLEARELQSQYQMSESYYTEQEV